MVQGRAVALRVPDALAGVAHHDHEREAANASGGEVAPPGTRRADIRRMIQHHAALVVVVAAPVVFQWLN